MATDKTEIYNLSLFHIGHTRRVESPTENSTERRNCEAVYNSAKRSLLTMANWSFAKTIVNLSLTGFTPKGWAYEYHYPQGCIKALEIARDSDAQKEIPFQTALRYNDETGAETRVIWTDEANAQLLFVRNVQSPTVFTPLFDLTLAYYMGIPLSRVMAKNTRVAGEMTQLFQFHLSEAIRAGEAEAQDKPEQDADWIKEAYGVNTYGKENL